MCGQLTFRFGLHEVCLCNGVVLLGAKLFLESLSVLLHVENFSVCSRCGCFNVLFLRIPICFGCCCCC